MNEKEAKLIIKYVVEITEPRWKQYDQHWKNIDKIFILHGYEQGGFEFFKFAPLLENKNILTINKLGGIIDSFEGENKYNRTFAGSLTAQFYIDLQNNKYGLHGNELFSSINFFFQKRLGKPGPWFWRTIWQMLICCRYLKNNYSSSFSRYLFIKYQNYSKKREVNDDTLLSLSSEDWERFKKIAKPWKDLYGIGENVFDFILGDIVEANFASSSFKLDSANEYFFKVTGISHLIPTLNRDTVIVFLKKLGMRYNLREINKGIYTYCSETESKNYGFCRSRIKCRHCKVNSICKQALL
ncbi:MAG: hypothetical protein HQK55_00550 [Deltaproteobacteria bacterium]|nr:hypothetical protein [Deltaproteobacteria bacterium]